MDLQSFLPIRRIVSINNIDDGFITRNFVDARPALTNFELNRVCINMLDRSLAYTSEIVDKPETGAVDILFLF